MSSNFSSVKNFNSSVWVRNTSTMFGSTPKNQVQPITNNIYITELFEMILSIFINNDKFVKLNYIFYLRKFLITENVILSICIVIIQLILLIH
jgi:hypothetical protein